MSRGLCGQAISQMPGYVGGNNLLSVRSLYAFLRSSKKPALFTSGNSYEGWTMVEVILDLDVCRPERWPVRRNACRMMQSQ